MGSMNTVRLVSVISLAAEAFACHDASPQTTAHIGNAGTGSNDSPSSRGGFGGTGFVELPASATLSSVDTIEQARALCAMVDARIDNGEYDRMVAGLCAVQGQIAGGQSTPRCVAAVTTCVQDGKSGIGVKQDCVPRDFPQCDTVTVGDYIQCTEAMIHAKAAYFGAFTCASDVSQFTEEFTPPSFGVEPFQRCPQLANAENS